MKKLANPISAALFVFFNSLSLFTVYKRLLNDLGIDIFGIWSLILTFNVFYPVFFMGLIGTLQRFLPEYKSLNEEIKSLKLIRTAFTLVFSISGSGLIALYFFYPLLLSTISNEKLYNILMLSKETCFLYIFCTSITLVLYSIIEGNNLGYLKNIILSIQSLFLLSGAILLETKFDFEDTASLFMYSSILTFVLSIIVLWLFFKIKPLQLFGFNYHILKSTKLYHHNYLKSNIYGLLLEPVNKVLLLIFAGPGCVAVYEMASKFVLQARTLLVAVVLSIMPYITKLSIKSPEKIILIYKILFKINFQLSSLTFFFITLILPYLSLYWFKDLNPDFLNVSYLLIIGWFINNLGLPAFAINAATNGIVHNTRVSLIILVVNLLLGIIFGFSGLKLLSVLSWILALVVGGILSIVDYNKKNSIETPIGKHCTIQILSMVGFSIFYTYWMKDNIKSECLIDSIWLPVSLFILLIVLTIFTNKKLILNLTQGKLEL